VARDPQNSPSFEVGPFQAGRWLEQNGEYGLASASYVETSAIAAKQEAQDKAVRAQARALRKLSRFNDPQRGMGLVEIDGDVPMEHEDFPADQQSSDEEMPESKVRTLSGSCIECKKKVEYNPEFLKESGLTCSDACFFKAFNKEVFEDDPLEKLQANKRTYASSGLQFSESFGFSGTFDLACPCPTCGTTTLFHKASCRAIAVSNLREATLHLLSKTQ
jgi:hypothetical protein